MELREIVMHQLIIRVETVQMLRKRWTSHADLYIKGAHLDSEPLI